MSHARFPVLLLRRWVMFRKIWLRLMLAGFCLLTTSMLTAQESAPKAAKVPANTPVVWCTSFSIDYVVRDVGASGPKKVEFYITSDLGRTWKLYGEDPDAMSPMMIRVPGEGTYGFMSVGTDNVGNRERAPLPGTKPDMFVIVDRTPPSAKWIKPDKTGLIKPSGIHFAWQSNDAHPAAGPVSIQYSSDQGHTWLPLKDGLPATGNMTMPAPTMRGANLSFRLMVKDAAGNRRIVTCPHQVLLDKIPPTATITGPRASGSLQVNIEYQAQDNPGGTGLSQVTMMYTIDNGQQWHQAGDDPDLKSPISFTSPVAGSVGLMLVVRDKAGNRSPMPAPGDSAPFTIDFDNEAPQVNLDPQLPENKQTLRGGWSVTLRWNAVDANIKQNSACVYYSKDRGDTWDKVAGNLPVNGPYIWSVPKEQCDNCLLKVSVEDTFGKRGEAVSLPFKIDSVPPTVIINNIRENPDELKQRNRNSADTAESKGGFIPMDNPEAIPGTHTPAGLDEGAGALPAGTLDKTVSPVKNTPPKVIAKARPLPPVTKEKPATINNKPVQPPVAPIPEKTTDTPVKPLPSTSVTTKSWIDDTPGKTTDRKQPDSIFPVPPAPAETSKITPTPSTGVKPKPVSRVPATPKPMPIPPAPKTGEEPKDRALQLLQQARELANAGKSAAAISRCKQAIGVDPANAKAQGMLSVLLFAEGRFAEAATAAGAALDLDPENTDYWQALGNAHLRLARNIDRKYKRRARINTLDPGLIALQEERDKSISKARKSFAQIIRLKPALKQGYNSMGETAYLQALCAGFAYRELGQGDLRQRNQLYREAIQAFTKSFAMGNVTYREAFHLGVSHFRIGQLDEAQRFLEQAVEEAANSVPKEAFWYLAEIHEQKGEFEDAIRYWEKTAETYTGGRRDRARQRAAALRKKLQK